MKRTTLITLGLSIAACSSSTDTQPPTSADYDDTAQAIASSTVTGRGGGAGGADTGAGDVIAMRDAMSLALGRLPIGFALHGDGRFHCNRMGVDNSLTVTCKDAAGATLARCDRTTDSATVDIQWSGKLETPSFTATVDRQGSWTITGLQSDTATFNGDSSFSLDSSFTSMFRPGETATAMFSNTAAYDAITISTADREITGGSATFEVKAHRTVTGSPMGKHDVDKAFDVTAVLTFNADHTATLVLDGTRTFTIDLTTGKVTRNP
jgi:hypothetical protein